MAIVSRELETGTHNPLIYGERDFTPSDPSIVNRVIGGFPVAKVVEAMVAAGLPEQIARTVVMGEQGRVWGLRKHHPYLIQAPLQILLDCGAIKPGFTMTELGPSMGSHLATLGERIMPGEYLGIDDDRMIVAGSIPLLGDLRERGLLPSNTYRIQVRKQETPVKLSEVAKAVLVSQYVDPREMFASLRQAAEIQVNTDIIHGHWEAPDEAWNNGELPITHPELDGSTGVVMKFTGKKFDSLLGESHEADLAFNPEMFDPRNHKFLIQIKGSTYHGGVVNTYTDALTKKRNAQTWTIVARKPGSNEQEEREIAGYAESIVDTFSYTFPWNSTSAAAIPELALKEGMRSVVFGSTVINNPFEIPIFLGLLRRYQKQWRAAEQITDQDGQSVLRAVGKGRPFKSIDQAIQIMAQYLDPNARLFERYDFRGALLFGSITTGDPEIYRKLVLGKPA